HQRWAIPCVIPEDVLALDQPGELPAIDHCPLVIPLCERLDVPNPQVDPPDLLALGIDTADVDSRSGIVHMKACNPELCVAFVLGRPAAAGQKRYHGDPGSSLCHAHCCSLLLVTVSRSPAAGIVRLRSPSLQRKTCQCLTTSQKQTVGPTDFFVPI